MLQDKAKLRRMGETEIERLKEELLQQKDRDDRLRSQANREHKEDFDKLYREHTDPEKMYDRQRERLEEARVGS